jgi:hypothetical protein
VAFDFHANYPPVDGFQDDVDLRAGAACQWNIATSVAAQVSCRRSSAKTKVSTSWPVEGSSESAGRRFGALPGAV